MIKKLCILSVLALFLYCGSMLFAEENGLTRIVDQKNPIKVYIKGFTNESGQGQIVPEDFQKALQIALINRKSVNFEMVKEPADSDIQISGTIKKYQYLERGPFKPSAGVGTMLLDAAASATHNYVEMLVLFIITDTKTGGILWQDTIHDYKKRLMTPQESIPVIYDKIARVFLWRSFGKSSSN